MSELIYTPIHLHTHLSNANMVEVVNDHEQYIDKAVEYGMKAIAFTEHGNVLSWYNKMMYAQSKGIKYIHGCEVYVTMTFDEKKRDNYHMVLLAKNHEGFKELNKMVSTGFERDEKHFYYNPRISWEDIKNTSDNIIVSTACLGSIIWQLHKSQDKLVASKFSEVIEWFAENKHRVFLEVQPHYHLEQMKYNKMLKRISEETGLRLVAGGDTHALTPEHDNARKILQKAKKVVFSDEDSFDLSFHSYEKMFNMFKKQEIFTDEEIHKAMQMTNVIADMVEEWEIDYSKKYPQLHDDPEKVFNQKIAEGIKFRGIDKKPLAERRKYAERIKLEQEVYKANEAINYMLLEDEVKTVARNNNVRYGYGRGSVSGSIIAYLMRITEMNSIDRNLNFARFMSKERISLADIDTDYHPIKRPIVQNYLINHPKLSCQKIITYNRLELKSAIKAMGKGLDMKDSILDDISEHIEDNEQYYRSEHPELFKEVDLVKGTIISVGAHACGIAVSPIPLDENMGLITVFDKKAKEVVTLTQINMGEIDAQNYVKLDLLGLDTIGIMSDTVDFVDGLEWEDILPENIDINDEKVWDSIIEDNIGIFQYESDFAHQIYKDLFSKETIAKIREKHPNFSYMDLFSLGNAILRPSGASYRSYVVQGEFYDNGHDELNKFLAPTLGRLVYQEDIINFLTGFCGYSGGEADVVRRAIGKKKKEVLDKLLPEIKERFIDTMIKEHGASKVKAEEIVDPFIEVIQSASNYGFSINHSDSYSFLGYVCAWLRYYYPLEFITASLNINKEKEEKTNNLIAYAKSKGFKINPIKFRKSKSGYMYEKETNSIYQGVEPIKNMSKHVGNALFELRNCEYETFTDFLFDIKDGFVWKLKDGNTMTTRELILHPDYEIKRGFEKEHEVEEVGKNALPINKTHINILIKLNYFSEFGGNAKLLKVFEHFDGIYSKTVKLDTKQKHYAKSLQFESELEDESLTLVEQATAEIEFLGHAETIDESIPNNIMIVGEIKENRNNSRIKAYQFSTGETREFKIGSRLYNTLELAELDVIQLEKADIKAKSKNIGGKWVASETEKEAWIKQLKFIRKGGNEDGEKQA